MSVLSIERKIIENETRQTLLKEQLDTLLEKQAMLTKRLEIVEKLQGIVQTLANKTLSQFKISFEACVSECLDVLFPDTFIFKVETKVTAGKCVCQFKFYDKHTNEELDPMNCCGGGALDLISFALRISVASLKGENPVFIMDEPFKFLSADKIPALCELLSSFASRYQFIMITHNNLLSECSTNSIIV